MPEGTGELIQVLVTSHDIADTISYNSMTLVPPHPVTGSAVHTSSGRILP